MRAVMHEFTSVSVFDRRDFLVDRSTNTSVVELQADEVFALVAELAKQMSMGGPIYLVVEADRIQAKEME